MLFLFVSEYDLERKRVTLNVPNTNFMSVTGTDGVRAYMRVKNDKQLQLEVSNVLYTTHIHMQTQVDSVVQIRTIY